MKKVTVVTITALLLCLFVASAFLLPSSHSGETWVRDNFYNHYVDLSGDTYYVMYVSSNRGWYIKAIDTSTTDQYRFSYSYVSGDTDYETAWTNRASTAGASAYQTFESAF